MALPQSRASFIALFAVSATVFSLIGASLAAEAPAPAPDSSAGDMSPSFAVGCAVAFITFLFGSALKI